MKDEKGAELAEPTPLHLIADMAQDLIGQNSPQVKEAIAAFEDDAGSPNAVGGWKRSRRR